MIKLVRKGWKVKRDPMITNVVHKPANETAFHFWLNVRSAAFFSVYETLGLEQANKLIHDQILPAGSNPSSMTPFNRAMLRIK